MSSRTLVVIPFLVLLTTTALAVGNAPEGFEYSPHIVGDYPQRVY
jgi:hypothetical protein